MTTLLLNAFLVLLMLFFGAMAYYPLFLNPREAEPQVQSGGEDVVLSVAPAPMEQRRPTDIRVPSTPDTDPNYPGHRSAA